MSTFAEGFANSFIRRQQDDRDKKFRKDEISEQRSWELQMRDQLWERQDKLRAEDRAFELSKLRSRSNSKLNKSKLANKDNFALVMGQLSRVQGEDKAQALDLMARIVQNPKLADNFAADYVSRKAQASKDKLNFDYDVTKWFDADIFEGDDFGNDSGLWVDIPSSAQPTNKEAEELAHSAAKLAVSSAIAGTDDPEEKQRLTILLSNFDETESAKMKVYQEFGSQILDRAGDGVEGTIVGGYIRNFSEPSGIPTVGDPVEETEAPSEAAPAESDVPSFDSASDAIQWAIENDAPPGTVVIVDGVKQKLNVN